MNKYPMGLTVKELKEAIKDWPEIDETTGEECEVWLSAGENLSSPAVGITPLNQRIRGGNISADMLFEAKK